MDNLNLNEREKAILRNIIQQFVITANPVGSRNIAKKFGLGLSPATIRNIMADLEEAGFLNHPHTSAGRVPTDKGYRIYVDSLMEPPNISYVEKVKINREISHLSDQTDDLVKLTAGILSDLTNQLACVTYPKIDTGILEKIQILQLTSSRILVVISIKLGLVKTITLELNAEFLQDQIDDVQQLLNERLSGLTFSEIRKTFKERFTDIEDNYKPIIRIFLDSADRIFSDINSTDKAIITGAKYILKQPEFESPDQFQSIIELIEDKDIIIHILDKKQTTDDVVIKIGSENEFEKFSEYSIITKDYNFGDIKGTLGIVGPRRMQYPKIIASVVYVAEVLSEYFKKGSVK
jgi:heat-inducible transcriptional repressor